MNILLTNDDGVNAPGLQALYQYLKDDFNVTVFAPDSDQSGTAHSLTLKRPLRVHQLEENVYAADGTPTDCVLLAFNGPWNLQFDAIISGINRGPNLCDDVLYSGTVAAAVEGALMGIPSISVSLNSFDAKADYATPASIMCDLLKEDILSLLDKNFFFNLNFPAVKRSEIEGLEITKLGRRSYRDIVSAHKDPRGRDYYWIAGEGPFWQGDEHCDFAAVQTNKISMTPLHFGLIANESIAAFHPKWVKTINTKILTQ